MWDLMSCDDNKVTAAAGGQPMETETSDAGQAAAAAAATSVEPQQRQGTKVSQKKVDQVKVCWHPY